MNRFVHINAHNQSAANTHYQQTEWITSCAQIVGTKHHKTLIQTSISLYAALRTYNSHKGILL